ncbi:MAG: hypothetical protein L3J04_08835 [Robiginitomaculum sp.]|nr:hypothetical protein [Robiginitomaculum sp.]
MNNKKVNYYLLIILALFLVSAPAQILAKEGSNTFKEPNVKTLIAQHFDGKQIDQRNSFGINLQDKDGSFLFTYIISVDTEDRLMKVFLVRPGKVPVKWSESKINADKNQYTVTTRSGKKFRINTNKKHFTVKGKKTKLVRLSTKGFLPSAKIEKKCNQFTQMIDSASSTGILPPYNGCCADCCWVHEYTGLPDWADAWCCMGYCGDSGSCTE